MTDIHIEVCSTKSEADICAQTLKMAPLNYQTVDILQADDLLLKVPGNNPLIIVRSSKFVVVGKKP